MTEAAGRLVAPRRLRQSRSWFSGTVWLVALAGVAAAATLGFGLHRGDPDGAARTANSELEAILEPGERIQHRVPVFERLWWDYYRHTYGILAATDRRLAYVGVPPEPLLHRDDGPPELVTASFPYVRGVRVTQGDAKGPRQTRIRVVSAVGVGVFGIAARDVGRLHDVLAASSREIEGLRVAAEAERRATEAAVAASRRPIYHLVQRGEALAGIARRYGVPAESLSVWNRLTTPRINAGTRLLVRPGRVS